MKIHKLLPACWSLSWRMVIHCAMQLKWKVSTALGNDVLGILKGVFSGIFHKLFPTFFCNGLLFYKTAQELFWGGYYWPGFRVIEICDENIFECECIMYFEAIWRQSFIIYNFNSENVGDILHTPHQGLPPVLSHHALLTTRLMSQLFLVVICNQRGMFCLFESVIDSIDKVIGIFIDSNKAKVSVCHLSCFILCRM